LSDSTLENSCSASSRDSSVLLCILNSDLPKLKWKLINESTLSEVGWAFEKYNIEKKIQVLIINRTIFQMPIFLRLINQHQLEHF